MKKEADRILKRSVLSVLVAAALYTPQAMAEFTEVVTEGSTVIGETVENGIQTVESGGTAENTTIDNGGRQTVFGTATDTTINNGGWQIVFSTADKTTINKGGAQSVYGTATDTTIYDGGTLSVDSGGKATGVDQKKGAALIATTATGTVVKGQYENGAFFIENGQADNVLLENGGRLDVVDGTTANNTTIRDGGELIVNRGGTTLNTGIESGGLQTVSAGGKTEDTIINEGGLMQNAGEDTGTTVKGGGVYELGRYNAGSTDYPDYLYYGTAGASDLTMEAGGRATVYAGTLTGATVSGKDASLTLMTPQTETYD
ncbi:autotransporter adhesin family protein, partial [Escherichia coli]|uniref:autotransporter adhesin family protein n=1 Tax=Escherichia coli TaxID=562 RepID=UPI0021C242C1